MFLFLVEPDTEEEPRDKAPREEEKPNQVTETEGLVEPDRTIEERDPQGPSGDPSKPSPSPNPSGPRGKF